MIVDEVQTGKLIFKSTASTHGAQCTYILAGFGATGTFWAHEHFNLQPPPDIVTFSKRAQTAGYYFGDEKLIPEQAFRQFNTCVPHSFLTIGDLANAKS